MKTCEVSGCAVPAKSRGLCKRHYDAWWRAANRDKVRAAQHRYYERNSATICERTAEVHRKRRATTGGREAEREAARARYRKNPEKARAKARRWYAANREKSQARSRRSMRKARAAEFGLTLTEMDAILARGCAICGACPGGRYIHLDHDHTNGKVRAALCHGCNTGLGSFGDDPARLRAAADYIEQHS